ncbi:MAG: DUF3820 family protein [Verrucomicrobiota bacterium]
MDEDLFKENLKVFLEDVDGAHMPFGRYGPKALPPHGAPLIDLPWEYLHWFSERGFPQSRLGELMEMVYHIKASGADEVFSPLRERMGGRHSLRPPKKRSSEFHDFQEGTG